MGMFEFLPAPHRDRAKRDRRRASCRKRLALENLEDRLVLSPTLPITATPTTTPIDGDAGTLKSTIDTQVAQLSSQLGSLLDQSSDTALAGSLITSELSQTGVVLDGLVGELAAAGGTSAQASLNATLARDVLVLDMITAQQLLSNTSNTGLTTQLTQDFDSATTAITQAFQSFSGSMSGSGSMTSSGAGATSNSGSVATSNSGSGSMSGSGSGMISGSSFGSISGSASGVLSGSAAINGSGSGSTSGSSSGSMSGSSSSTLVSQVSRAFDSTTRRRPLSRRRSSPSAGAAVALRVAQARPAAAARAR